jgi:hypothetical protein
VYAPLNKTLFVGLSLSYLKERNYADVLWERKRLARMRAECPCSQRSWPKSTVVQAKVLVCSRVCLLCLVHQFRSYLKRVLYQIYNESYAKVLRSRSFPMNSVLRCLRFSPKQFYHNSIQNYAQHPSLLFTPSYVPNNYTPLPYKLQV